MSLPPMKERDVYRSTTKCQAPLGASTCVIHTHAF